MNDICEVRIQTEGFKDGYIVKIVGEDDTKTYHLDKNELVDIVNKIRNVAEAKGDVDSVWKKVA